MANLRRMYRTFWQRFMAALLDAVVLYPVGWIDEMVMQQHSVSALSLLWFVVSTSIAVVYSIVGHAKFGYTLGKWVMRVRVVSLDGTVPGLRRASLRDIVPICSVLYGLIRGLARAWDGQSPFMTAQTLSPWDTAVGMVFLGWVLLEILTMLFNERRRAVHDFIAGTVVVRTGWDPRLAADPSSLSGMTSTGRSSPFTSAPRRR